MGLTDSTLQADAAAAHGEQVQRTREDMQRMIADLQKAFDGHVTRLESAIKDGKSDLGVLGNACVELCMSSCVCCHMGVRQCQRYA